MDEIAKQIEDIQLFVYDPERLRFLLRYLDRRFLELYTMHGYVCHDMYESIDNIVKSYIDYGIQIQIEYNNLRVHLIKECASKKLCCDIANVIASYCYFDTDNFDEMYNDFNNALDDITESYTHHYYEMGKSSRHALVRETYREELYKMQDQAKKFMDKYGYSSATII